MEDETAKKAGVIDGKGGEASEFFEK